MRAPNLCGNSKKCNGFFTRWCDECLNPSVCRTFFGSVCGIGGSKLKIAKGFSKLNSEPWSNPLRVRIAPMSARPLLSEIDGLLDEGELAMLAELQAKRKVVMHTAKQDVERLLHQLPDDSTLEAIQYHLYVLDKIKRGQRAIADGKQYTSEEARARLSQWITL